MKTCRHVIFSMATGVNLVRTRRPCKLSKTPKRLHKPSKSLVTKLQVKSFPAELAQGTWRILNFFGPICTISESVPQHGASSIPYS